MTADRLAHAKRIVVKIGSALLIDPNTGAPSQAWLSGLANEIADRRARGLETAIVSSGAVALGRRALGLQGALRLDEKQAAAAAGQAKLMRAYEDAFAPHGIPVAQALLTPDDTERRRRWLNARATLETLLARKAAPVINENDTVATQELRYGDNDRLAARVAQMIGADVLVLLSDIDGLYDRDPRAHPDARHIPEVRAITEEVMAMAGGPNAAQAMGSGGMRTKLQAARIAQAAGCATVILAGAAPAPLTRLLQGERATWFSPPASPKQAYKAWIAGSLAPRGTLRVDAGAAGALMRGKSLLPAGVVGVEGAFEKGDAVRLTGPDGAEIARGIARYDAPDAQRIMGLKSSEIETVLGFTAGPALVHADDVALLG